MTNTATQTKEVKHRMHILHIFERIKQCTYYIRGSSCNNPPNNIHMSRWLDNTHQRFKSYQYASAHRNKANCLKITMLFQSGKAQKKSHSSTKPYEYEQAPSPSTGVTQ